MYSNTRAIFLILTIVAVLFVSAVGTTSVYADDGAPPPPDSGEVVPPESEGEPVVTEPTEAAPPAEEEQPVEEAAPPAEEPLEETAVPEEAPVVEEPLPAEEETEAASILEQVPDDTTVTVLNAEGEVQPLTSQESADAILTSDPIWCPAWTPPTPGVDGCTEAFDSFDALLEFLQANEGVEDYQQDGTIFVQMGEYTGPETSIDFNSYNFQTLNQFSLTVQGGWNPADESTDATTDLNVPLIIGSGSNLWVGSLTINNINISGVSNQTGLVLYSEQDIMLSNVSVTESQGGADLNAGGYVTILDSQFDNNRPSKADGFGLKVKSGNDVFLGGVSASNNEAFGANIDSAADVVIRDSIFSGNVAYTYSCSGKTATGGYGLKVVAADKADLLGVTAEDNLLFGASLDAGLVKVVDSLFNSNGSSSMSNPKGFGLEVVSDSTVEMDQVHADGNQLFGANVQAQGEVTITNSFFDGNKSYKCSCNGTSYYGYGLEVVTTGDIVLVDVSGSGNHLFGAHLKGADVIVIGNLQDGSPSVFNNNGTGNKTQTGRGLEIESTGEVTLNNVQANNNQKFGANIVATGNVAIANSFFNGHKHTYGSSCSGTVTTGGYGLQVVTDGLIALSVVEANNNYTFGAKLVSHDAEFGVTIGGDVDSNGNPIYSSFSNNQSGLEIDSDGPVALNLVKASDNKLYGADIQAAGNVAINNSFFNGNKSYTSSSCKGKTFYGYGLKVVTTSNVAVQNVTAEGNYVSGAYLEGLSIAVSTSSFSNNGTGTLSDHVGKGLEVESTGAESVVNLSGVTASNNQLFGAKVNADGLVIVNNSVFNGNKSYTSSCYCKTYDGYGLRVVTDSNIKLDGVTANENYLYGAHLEGANVEVLNSFFNKNASPTEKGKTPTGRGLEVISTGDTLLKNVHADENQLFGATVEAGGKVVVNGSFFNNNKYYTYSSCKGYKSAGYGLKVVTTNPDLALSTITLTDVEAVQNGAEGAILQSPSTVDVSESTFSDNGATGLSITAGGTVTLTNVTASNNDGDGVYVKGACTNEVQVVGGTFTENDRYGIKIVDATYSPDGTQVFVPANGSGSVFQSGCVTTTSVTSGSSNNTQSSSGWTGSHSYRHYRHSHSYSHGYYHR